MATAAQPKLLTAEEFMAADLGEGTFELVRGEVVEVPPPMPEHGRVCVNSGFALESYGRQSGLGYALSNDSAVLTEPRAGYGSRRRRVLLQPCALASVAGRQDPASCSA